MAHLIMAVILIGITSIGCLVASRLVSNASSWRPQSWRFHIPRDIKTVTLITWIGGCVILFQTPLDFPITEPASMRLVVRPIDGSRPWLRVGFVDCDLTYVRQGNVADYVRLLINDDIDYMNAIEYLFRTDKWTLVAANVPGDSLAKDSIVEGSLVRFLADADEFRTEKLKSSEVDEAIVLLKRVADGARLDTAVAGIESLDVRFDEIVLGSSSTNPGLLPGFLMLIIVLVTWFVGLTYVSIRVRSSNDQSS